MLILSLRYFCAVEREARILIVEPLALQTSCLAISRSNSLPSSGNLLLVKINSVSTQRLSCNVLRSSGIHLSVIEHPVRFNVLSLLCSVSKASTHSMCRPLSLIPLLPVRDKKVRLQSLFLIRLHSAGMHSSVKQQKPRNKVVSLNFFYLMTALHKAIIPLSTMPFSQRHRTPSSWQISLLRTLQSRSIPSELISLLLRSNVLRPIACPFSKNSHTAVKHFSVM